MEEGFLRRLSRRRMAGPIYIIILLLSPGAAKIDDADVEQVVVGIKSVVVVVALGGMVVNWLCGGNALTISKAQCSF